MPSRNVLKIDLPNSYYHIYLRGNSRNAIFMDVEDHKVFLNLFKRYLSPDPVMDNSGRQYPNYAGRVDLLAFCLMSNHFHLLIFQHESGELSHMMRGFLTTYSRYFNKKYGKSGPLFESRYKSSRISNDVYLMHISRYIHLNPKDWRTWRWSSLDYYLGRVSAPWIKPDSILGLFSSTVTYEAFLEDYQDHKHIFETIKHELAN